MIKHFTKLRISSSPVTITAFGVTFDLTQSFDIQISNSPFKKPTMLLTTALCHISAGSGRGRVRIISVGIQVNIFQIWPKGRSPCCWRYIQTKRLSCLKAFGMKSGRYLAVAVASKFSILVPSPGAVFSARSGQIFYPLFIVAKKSFRQCLIWYNLSTYASFPSLQRFMHGFILLPFPYVCILRKAWKLIWQSYLMDFQGNINFKNPQIIQLRDLWKYTKTIWTVILKPFVTFQYTGWLMKGSL